jgi:hypothetical protein
VIRAWFNMLVKGVRREEPYSKGSKECAQNSFNVLHLLSVCVCVCVQEKVNAAGIRFNQPTKNRLALSYPASLTTHQVQARPCSRPRTGTWEM